MTRKLPPDYALWEDVTRSVKPLHKAKKKTAPKPDVPAPEMKAKAKPAAAPKPVARPPSPRHDPPLITGLDRRQERRMMRGQVEIEARIDLHGTGIERSHERLLN
ncbi:MAG TPA: hypothetical protein VL101_06065, partial [Nordella sp.]|nr:hypothetical protein [Nordella sp.]